MSIFDRARALADRQMADKRQLGAVRRTGTLGGSATDSRSGFGQTTDYPCNLLLFPVDRKDIDGTFIKSGDWRALVAFSQPANAAAWSDGHPLGNIEGITPTTTDRLVTTEGVLTIVDPGKFAPDGTVTHYSMVVRK